MGPMKTGTRLIGNRVMAWLVIPAFTSPKRSDEVRTARVTEIKSPNSPSRCYATKPRRACALADTRRAATKKDVMAKATSIKPVGTAKMAGSTIP